MPGWFSLHAATFQTTLIPLLKSSALVVVENCSFIPVCRVTVNDRHPRMSIERIDQWAEI